MNQCRAVVLCCVPLMAASLLLSCSSKKYSQEQFERMVKGRTENEVLEAVGKPKRIITRQMEKRTYWYYVYKTYNPSSGQAIPQTELVFRDGRVIKVNTE